MVLGHEASGTVERVGAGVERVRPGDRVILNFRPNCGWCAHCSRGEPVLCNGSESDRWLLFDGTARLHTLSGRDLHHFARVASFAEYAVVPESGAVPVSADVPLGAAALIGCSVMTGVGAVVNTARVEAGSSVLVVGCGGVGLNCIQGAALAGAERIIAVDVNAAKLEYAAQFGATDVLDAGEGDTAARVIELTGGGVDYAFEAIGLSRTIVDCYESTRPGGTTVVVGMAAEDEMMSIPGALPPAHREGAARLVVRLRPPLGRPPEDGRPLHERAAAGRSAHQPHLPARGDQRGVRGARSRRGGAQRAADGVSGAPWRPSPGAAQRRARPGAAGSS